MKNIKKTVFLMISVFALAACNKFGGGANGEVSISFWGYGEPTEIRIFRGLVDQFNEEHKGEIHVEYTTKPGSNYYTTVAQVIAGRRCPDVVYVGDDIAKSWADNDYIIPLDDYVAQSEIIKIDEMWNSCSERYRFNPQTRVSGGNEPLWALPKDIGPSVIYYNVKYFQDMGIKIISKDPEEITDDFVSSFNTQNSTHFTKEQMKRGFYRPNIDDTSSWSIPSASEEMIFNNRIPMSWVESENLFKIFTQSYNPQSPSKYGFFTEWWFSYGWSVGGDCIKWSDRDNRWYFSLGDTTQLYQKDGKFYETQVDGSLPVPTMLEAFTKFVQLSQPKTVDIDGKGHYGLEVTPSPNTLNTVGKESYFSSGRVAIMDDRRAAVPVYRQTTSLEFDCAPHPVAPNGIQAGHSGSVGFCIPTNSKHKDAAFKFIEFMAGEEGQTKQAESGFNIPNQKTASMTESFLQTDQCPKNSIIFVRAAEYQKAGDWNYLMDDLWIDVWADRLNDEVRNGRWNLTQFFENITDASNRALDPNVHPEYYRKVN